MSVRYSDRWSVRYSRSLSEVKGSQSETEAETDVEEDSGASRLFVAEPVSDRRLGDASVSDVSDLAQNEGEPR